MRAASYILVILVLIFSSCGGGSSTSSQNKSVDPVPAPGKVTLIFPDKDALCTQGTNASATQSTVTFKWNTSTNTNSFEINYKNLLTGEVKTILQALNQQDITLNTATPYDWWVVSKSLQSTATTQSDIWRFYNSGPGITSYSPYPADLLAPTLAQSVTASGGSVTLKWSGNDVDNDITGYDVYIDNTNASTLSKSGITNNTFDVSVSSGKTYFWKIVTKDSKGNTSTSSVYQFNIL